MAEALLKGLALGLILALSVGPVIFTIIKQRTKFLSYSRVQFLFQKNELH